MSLETTYKEFLTEQFIKQKLEAGEAIDTVEFVEELEVYLEALNLTLPQFIAENYHVVERTSSSATTHGNALSSMRNDLTALYREMQNLTKLSITSYERWDDESRALEKKLIDLEDRIGSLLFLTQDTEGHHSIIVDNFTDTFKTDQTWTTAKLDIHAQSVELGPTTTSIKRIFLNNLQKRDVTFSVRNTTNYLGSSDLTKSKLTDIFSQQSSAWWRNIRMAKPGPIICELTVKLGESTETLNKIILELHDSVEANTISITPLLSTDGTNYDQIASNTFTIEARKNALFTFPDQEAKWVKFLLTKKGPDNSSSDEGFGYQFGFKSIRFYGQAFTSDSVQYFCSEPLSVLDQNGNVKEFEKVSLETCERIEADTEVKYWMTFSNDPTVPLTSTTSGLVGAATWYPITPINRAESLIPKVIDIGDLSETTIGDTETVQISYDGRATDSTYISPAGQFYLISEDIVSGVVNANLTTATANRYDFVNLQDRILNYQFKLTDYSGSGSGNGIDVDFENLELFRNIGEQGLLITDDDSQVRGTLRGWRFEDPYYTCVVEVRNPNGMEMDVGDSSIVIDDVSYNNKVPSTVLTGKTNIGTGLHRVKVHKNNWKEVTPSLNTVSGLETADPLYPYNHKLLIEGYLYGSSFPTTETKIYKGADVFAEKLLKQVSVFDFLYNTPNSNYDIFCRDLDAPTTHTGGNEPTQVILVKVDNGNPDSQNERFMIRFKQINLLQTYLRLRADLSTSNSNITPSFQSYKIKLG